MATGLYKNPISAVPSHFLGGTTPSKFGDDIEEW